MKATLLAWWGKRNARERLIVALTALVLSAALLDRLALAPIRARTASLRTELTAAKNALDALHDAVDEQARRGASEGQARKLALAQRRDKAEATIQAAEAELITPQQMQRQLALILERMPNLRVIALHTLPPEAVPLPGIKNAAGTAAPGSAAPPAQAGAGATQQAGLYQHGLEITVEGRYVDLVAYLEALEHAPYRVYWRALDLKVDAARGVPVTKISVFTLSRDPTWLSL